MASENNRTTFMELDDLPTPTLSIPPLRDMTSRGSITALHNAGSMPRMLDEEAPPPADADRLSSPMMSPKKEDFKPLDWDGPNDPANPMNWPLWEKIYHSANPGLYSFVITFGSSVITPGIDQITKRFNVSTTAAFLSLSLYVLGLAFGPVLAAPLSETYGRRAVYLISLPVSAFFTLGAAFSQNFASLLVTRFFAGFLGSPVLAVGGGTNVDVWSSLHQATASSFYLFSAFLGPGLGPVIGGFAAQYKDWRWTQFVILFAAAGIFLASLFQKETYKKIVLSRRAKKLGIPQPKGPSGLAKIKFLLTVTLIRPIHMLFTEPIVSLFSLYVAFNFSVLFALFGAFPFVFMGVYHFDTAQSGLVFVSIVIGSALGVVTALIIDRYFYRPMQLKAIRESEGGRIAPEHRLYVAMLGSFGLPIGLFWFAWTSRPSIHWISPTLAAIPFAWGNLCVFLAAALYLIDTYGQLSGASAFAANGLLRYLAGAAFPLFTIQMYERLTIPWATSLLGFISLLLLPVPWALFYYGQRIRAGSNYAVTK